MAWAPPLARGGSPTGRGRWAQRRPWGSGAGLPRPGWPPELCLHHAGGLPPVWMVLPMLRP
eukprot:1356824-Alexandrium_andersonii.AAC.1